MLQDQLGECIRKYLDDEGNIVAVAFDVICLNMKQ